jgi:hypothetical protein
MNTDQCYEKVAQISGSLEKIFDTDYKRSLIAFHGGELSGEEFTRELRERSVRCAAAYDELRGLRFPRRRQQWALARFTGVAKDYRAAIDLIIEAVETENSAIWAKVNARLERAGRTADGYFEFIQEDVKG